MHPDMVRPGIICCGLLPPPGRGEEKIFGLKPATSVKIVVTHIQYIESNVPVSCGAIYVTGKRIRIATLPIEYADGFMRALSDRWQFIAADKKVSVIGIICTDRCMIDVSPVNNICAKGVVAVI